MPRIEISIPEQSLVLLDNGRELRRYLVSTSRNGPGERQGSFCTPRGEHIVRAKIGAGQPVNTVFVRRRPTGEIWTPEMAETFPGRDWILTRILWLSGCEPGRNRMEEVDTMRSRWGNRDRSGASGCATGMSWSFSSSCRRGQRSASLRSSRALVRGFTPWEIRHLTFRAQPITRRYPCSTAHRHDLSGHFREA